MFCIIIFFAQGSTVMSKNGGIIGLVLRGILGIEPRQGNSSELVLYSNLAIKSDGDLIYITILHYSLHLMFYYAICFSNTGIIKLKQKFINVTHDINHI